MSVAEDLVAEMDREGSTQKPRRQLWYPTLEDFDDLIPTIFGEDYVHPPKRATSHLNPGASDFRPAAAAHEQVQPHEEALHPVPSGPSQLWNAEQDAEKLHPNIIASVEKELGGHVVAIATHIVSQAIIKFIKERTSRRAQHRGTEATDGQQQPQSSSCADSADAVAAPTAVKVSLNPVAKEFVPQSPLTRPESLENGTSTSPDDVSALPSRDKDHSHGHDIESTGSWTPETEDGSGEEKGSKSGHEIGDRVRRHLDERGRGSPRPAEAGSGDDAAKVSRPQSIRARLYPRKTG